MLIASVQWVVYDSIKSSNKNKVNLVQKRVAPRRYAPSSSRHCSLLRLNHSLCQRKLTHTEISLASEIKSRLKKITLTLHQTQLCCLTPSQSSVTLLRNSIWTTTMGQGGIHMLSAWVWSLPWSWWMMIWTGSGMNLWRRRRCWEPKQHGGGWHLLKERGIRWRTMSGCHRVGSSEAEEPPNSLSKCHDESQCSSQLVDFSLYSHSLFGLR